MKRFLVTAFVFFSASILLADGIGPGSANWTHVIHGNPTYPVHNQDVTFGDTGPLTATWKANMFHVVGSGQFEMETPLESDVGTTNSGVYIGEYIRSQSTWGTNWNYNGGHYRSRLRNPTNNALLKCVDFEIIKDGIPQ